MTVKLAMTAISTETSVPAASGSAAGAVRPVHSRIRLDFLDGIRGLASLDIALCHAGIQVDGHNVCRLLPTLTALTFAHTAVAIFIVLSGYCLMLPVVRSAEISGAPDSLQGILPYLGRRARRILPAYYAALALCLIVMALVPGGPKSVGNWWSTMWPAFSPGVLISHLLLVHNFNAPWIYKIDAPMWSVATEWQIYFLFPLLLLPLHRRLGAVAAIVGAIVVSLSVVYLFPGHELGCPWFLALFAMGMLAAGNYPSLPNAAAWRAKIPWGWAFLVTLAVWAIMAIPTILSILPAIVATMYSALLKPLGGLKFVDNWKFRCLYELVSGISVACFLSWAAGRSVKEHLSRGLRRSLTLSLLSSGFAIGLGTFSYSLYLTHALIEALFETLFSRLPLGPNTRAFSFVIVATVAAVAFAYVFYLAFEKPFMKRQAHRTK